MPHSRSYNLIDAAGIRRAEKHVMADKQCEVAGIYVVENLTKLDQLIAYKNEPLSMIASWINLPGKTGLPYRVVVSLSC